MHVLTIYKAIAYLIYLCVVVVFSCSFLGFCFTKKAFYLLLIYLQKENLRSSEKAMF